MRFETLTEAVIYAGENNLRPVEWVYTKGGTRINCVNPKGQPRTLRIADTGVARPIFAG